MRLGDIDAVTEKLLHDSFCSWHDFNTVMHALDEAPTVDALPVKHGRWIDNKDSIIGEIIERNCSLCGQRTTGLYDHLFPYCPNCGAKMDVEKKEDET